MLRLVVPTALLAVVSSLSPGQEPVIGEDLEGAVRRMEIREKVLAGDMKEFQGEESRREVLVFDEGTLARRITFLPEDRYLWESTFTYNERGKLVERSAYNEDGTLKWRYEYHYDSEGRLVREVSLDSREEVEQVLVYEYADGRLVEEVMHDGRDTIQWRKTYSYDDRERVEAWSMYYPDGTRIKKVRRSYDDQGRLVREQHTNELGIVYHDIHYSFSGASRQPTTITTYDGEGNLQRKETYEYNRRDNLQLKQVVLPRKDYHQLITHTYRYDQNGNWIRQRVTRYAVCEERRELIQEKVIRREIDYKGEN
jgi:YD repeat-containing protein